MLNYFSSVLGLPKPIVFIILICFIYFLYWLYIKNGKFNRYNTGKIATSGFAELKELRNFNKNDGIQLSKDFSLTEKMCFEHICVIGPTGAGKTTSIFYPNLLQPNSFSRGRSSIIITDPKGELYKDTSSYQERLGRNTVLFAPLEPQFSFKYNPLEYCKDVSEVIDLAGNLLAVGGKAIELQSGKSGGNDANWINMGKPLVAAALLYVWYKPKGLNTIANALDLITNTTDEQLNNLLGKSKHPDVVRQFNSFNQAAGSEKTVSSIKITLAANLQIYTDPAIRELTSRNTFNLAELRSNPTALYISYPERHSARIAPLLSIFFTQAINELMDDVNLKGDYLPTYFLFDEFANIGQIPGFSTLASTVRSRKISFLCCLQSKNQLRSVYGNFDEDILANLKTKAIYGALQDTTTTRYISDLCGETEIRVASRSVSDNLNRADSHNFSTTKKKLLTPDEVMRISKDKILLLVHNNKPYLSKVNPFYKNKSYTNNIRQRNKTIV
ncbi:VirD4-like conjugal transfer protein, CD1115 family [Clostridium perfringens]|uniref:VirD4-like conjugal transfer protein, CD1115 family n=1 Tax=Clostridium perfringens TaxID=1502 RepID=UPI003D01037E|nr:type IV secretory system conjugative DNA transfer family protein [Clostridium perfringens]MDM0807574.1 type IV secretory system conjugative DNA transfer family protein [Clostridium perfringens]